jgi:outer membrane lipoprotein-sorting protein
MQQGIGRIAAVALAFGLAGAAYAQTADELVAKNLKAKGGLENLKAVQGMKITGRVILPGAEGSGGGVDIPMTITTKKRPDRFRQESEFQGQKIVIGFDGTSAWIINSRMSANPQPIEGDRLDAVKQQADLDGPLVDYKTKGTTIELQGLETVDGKKVHKLKVTPKTGRIVTLYLDAETGLETKTVMEPPVDVATQGSPLATLESVFSNYQSVDGNLTMPHMIQQKVNGQVLQIIIEKIEISPSVEDSIFTMPTAGSSPAPKP